MSVPARCKVTFKLYPTPKQADVLARLLVSHQQFYNAALEERISAWRNGRHSISYENQTKSLTANRRLDEQHKLSAAIAGQCFAFAMEKLCVKNMTASAAGTFEKPGKNVQQKAGLNREVLDTAPARLMALIRRRGSSEAVKVSRFRQRGARVERTTTEHVNAPAHPEATRWP